jgi:hypothetical protein
MLRVLLIAIAGVLSAEAGSIEFSSAALSAGSRPSLDNIKGSWGSDVSLGGVDAHFEAEFDKSENADFLNEASLSGNMDQVAYKVTQNFVSGVSKLALSTKQFGSTLKATVTSKLKDAADTTKVDSVSATKGMNVGGVDLEFEPSFVPEGMSGTLKTTASYDLGSGASILGELSATNAGDISYDVEAKYSTDVEGRAVSATIKPLDQKATLEVADTQLGVATATYTVGDEKPTLTLKRSFAF